MATYIGGIDPGLGTGGFVVLRRDAPGEFAPIVFAASLVERKRDRDALAASLPAYYDERPGDRHYALADLRAQAQARRALAALDAYAAEHPPMAAIAIESFIDQGSRAAGPFVKDRWKTPHAIGRLVTNLELRGYTTQDGTLLWQDAGVILRQLAEEIRRLARGERVVEGAQMLTNDHLRKAWAHAQGLADRY